MFKSPVQKMAKKRLGLNEHIYLFSSFLTLATGEKRDSLDTQNLTKKNAGWLLSFTKNGCLELQ